MDLILLLIAMGVAVAAIGTDASRDDPPEDAEIIAPEPVAPQPEPEPQPDQQPEPEQQPEPQPEPEPLPEPEPEPAPIFERESDTGDDSARASPGFEAEDQTPSGKFTTAAEVRPILEATKDSWVALRDFGGEDLLYFTQLLAWRCGLHQISFAINDDAPQVLTIEPCHIDTAQPNAITSETIQPYLAFGAGSVQSVTIDLLYDDLGEATARFERPAILMP